MATKIIKFEDRENEGFNKLVARIYRYEDFRSGIGHVYVDFGYQDEITDEFHFFGDYSVDNLHLMNALQISCVYKMESDSLSEKRVPFGFAVEYRDTIRNLSFDTAERYAEKIKFLKKIERRYHNHIAEFGSNHYANFGLYVRLMLALMGVENAVKGDLVTPVYDVEYYINRLIAEE